MFDEVCAAASPRPRLTFSKALGYAVAACIHGLTLLFVVGGIFLIATHPTQPLAYVGGVLALSIAWALRPRLGAVRGVAERPEAIPGLTSLVARVAVQEGARPVSAIVLTAAFNAGLGRVGWRQRSVIYLGLPMLMVLDPQETRCPAGP
jgi:hypothetical protein